MAMELLYNPDRMPDEEIKATFVAREQLVDELATLVEGQPDGAGVQHAIINAPRGMGKTTVLLMVKFAMEDRGLNDRWQAVKFPEESYGIYELADFWIETLNLIAADTANTELRQLADSLKTKYVNNDELQEAAYAAIKDWRRKHGKRLLLLVENFDQILEQINDERDNARLRDALMNDGTLMLLGGATTFFKEARAYDQPLYNFFKIYNLTDLKSAQIYDLLRRRAKHDSLLNFEIQLKQNTSRLRALEYFTGGNPRLVLMLYRVVSQSGMAEVQKALEKLLDDVTPFYKSKTEVLPAQQRKILDHIARVSSETNEGLTPSEIAGAVRLSSNQVSSQLKRLSENGYVRAANLRGRSSYYMLSEPLYAIWYQMRFGRNARERMGWIVNFLKVWYDREELFKETDRLIHRYRQELQAGRHKEAGNVVVTLRYLAEAFEKGANRDRVMDEVIQSFLQVDGNRTILVEILENNRLERFSDIVIRQNAEYRGEALPDLVERFLNDDRGLSIDSARALAEIFRSAYKQFSLRK
jgi:DNA-binding transcriptional ArsR family regulator